MRADLPFFLVRAHPAENDRARFLRWFRTVHRKDIAAVPGVASFEMGTTAAGTILGIYTFEGLESVQSALSSPQASYVQGTWAQWAPILDEFEVELFAPITPIPIFRLPN